MASPTTKTVVATGGVLSILAASQFLMTLDTSVMNVSISEVAADVHTTVSGVQTAITLFTLVMASLMITGGKVGSLLGRRRAFMLGLVIYGTGSLVTAVAHSLPVLILGWSLLEGIGAALIMPAVVALVAGNFPVDRRTAAYGAVAAAGATAVAVGPLLGGAVTTFASWRWVFLGEVVMVIVILALSRRLGDTPVAGSRQFDGLGAVLSIIGLTLVVFGVLRSGEWGWIAHQPGAPSIFCMSPVIWMLMGGIGVLAAFLAWEARRTERGREPLVQPSLLENRRVVGGLLMFFFQYLSQAGVFFTIPLFLSVVLEMSALATGIRLLPLSAALLLSAIFVPRLFPKASPRRVVRVGLMLMIAATVTLIAGIAPDAGAEVVAIPMLLMGFGIGSLASQLAAVTVSAVPESMSEEVGGLQNTAANLGASLGTALAGAVLIASLTSGVAQGISSDPRISAEVKAQATTSLTGEVPFLSNSQLRDALDKSNVSASDAKEIEAVNTAARTDALDQSLGVIALLEVLALAFSSMIRRRPLSEGDEDTAPVAEPVGG
jgi:EmrB/QacA subfamily drug resistance transporter